MDHIGIDVHKKESRICILADGGELIERRIRTEPARPHRDRGLDGQRVGGAVSGRPGPRGDRRRPGLRAHVRDAAPRVLIEVGEPLTYVQEQLGHHSPAFTLAFYGRLILLPMIPRRYSARYPN